MTPRVISETQCILGEGPLWHPGRAQLFWFDILSNALRTIVDGTEHVWSFETSVSAAGWVDQDRLLIASAVDLRLFDLTTGQSESIAPLEPDNPVTRSNDGRADPWGGFWIGTMGYDAEPKAGAIYRFFRGELRRLVPDVTIPNAICFAPDGGFAYFTDTVTRKIWRQRLREADGWPEGAPDVFLDFGPNAAFGPDGAIVDTSGGLVLAQWGTGSVTRFDPEGCATDSFHVPTPQASCPCLGGSARGTLYVTTAAEGLDDPEAGKLYAFDTDLVGQDENRVILT